MRVVGGYLNGRRVVGGWLNGRRISFDDIYLEHADEVALMHMAFGDVSEAVSGYLSMGELIEDKIKGEAAGVKRSYSSLKIAIKHAARGVVGNNPITYFRASARLEHSANEAKGNSLSGQNLPKPLVEHSANDAKGNALSGQSLQKPLIEHSAQESPGAAKSTRFIHKTPLTHSLQSRFSVAQGIAAATSHSGFSIEESFSQDSTQIIGNLSDGNVYEGISIDLEAIHFLTSHTSSSSASDSEVHHSADAAVEWDGTFVPGEDSEFYFVLNSELTQSIYLTQSEANAVTVDWGDESPTESPAELSAGLTHQYSSPGNYTVKIGCKDGKMWSPGGAVSIDGTTKTCGFCGPADVFKKNTYPTLRGFLFGKGMRLDYQYGFANCTEITTVTFPETITSIADYCFIGCARIATVNIKTITQWLGMSFSAEYANPLNTSETNPTGETIEPGLYVDGNLLTTLFVPTAITKIKQYAFSRYKKLTRINLNNVTQIEAGAFQSCKSLSEIENISAIVTSIGDSAFHSCTSLSSSVLPLFTKNIGASAFRGCTSLKTLNFGSVFANVTETIGEYCFEGCTGLEMVSFGKITSIPQRAFQTCTSLERVTLGDVVSIGAFAFSGCRSLTVITPSSKTFSVADNAFSYCHALSEVSFLAKASSLGGYVFANCDGLVDIVYNGPSRIGYSVFQNCKNLTHVEIASGRTFVNSSTGSASCGLFKGNNALKYISISAPYIQTTASASYAGYTYILSDIPSIEKIWIRSSVTTISGNGEGTYGYLGGLLYNYTKSNPTIYCEPASRPSGWVSYFNSKNSTARFATIWGQTSRPF